MSFPDVSALALVLRIKRSILVPSFSDLALLSLVSSRMLMHQLYHWRAPCWRWLTVEGWQNNNARTARHVGTAQAFQSLFDTADWVHLCLLFAVAAVALVIVGIKQGHLIFPVKIAYLIQEKLPLSIRKSYVVHVTHKSACCNLTLNQGT